MEPAAQVELARDLVASAVGATPRLVAPLTGGQVGRVFRAETEAASYLVKFVRWWAEPDFAHEPVDDRVYGNRFSNLTPAYDRLSGAGLPTPRLHGWGALKDPSVFWSVFDYLEGDPDDFSPAWFAAAGASLRRLHAVTRPYQGWVGMSAPLPMPWPAAFDAALASNFAKARPVLPPVLTRAIERRMRGTPALDDPAEFVLSHTDGLQAVLKRRGGAWEVLGHIDVEDMQYTDRRFVLTGFELSHRLAGRTVPDAFWRAYGPAPGGRRLRYELLYLLVWARVLQGDPASLATCLTALGQLVG